MLVHEQSLVLRYLRQRATATFADVLKVCLPGSPVDWGKRVLSDLEWLGYVTVYSSGDGEPLAIQITDKGREHVRQREGLPRASGGLTMP